MISILIQLINCTLFIVFSSTTSSTNLPRPSQPSAPSTLSTPDRTTSAPVSYSVSPSSPSRSTSISAIQPSSTPARPSSTPAILPSTPARQSALDVPPSTPANPLTTTAIPPTTPAGMQTTPTELTPSTPARPPRAFDPPVNSVSNEPLLVRPQVLPKKSERGQKRNRKLVDDNLDRELASLDSQIKEVSKPVQKSERQLYADSIVPSLERLTNYQFAVAKNRINNVLFELEFAEIERPRPLSSLSAASSFSTSSQPTYADRPQSSLSSQSSTSRPSYTELMSASWDGAWE